MIIHAYILCFNEALMIRHTINHYLQFCDRITILDNGSTDGTLDIIAKEYPSIIVQPFDTGGQIRDDIYLQLKNNCWKASRGHADWVIVCDCDELLYHDKLEYLLKGMHAQGEILPLITGYNMFAEAFPDNYTRPIMQQVNMGTRAPQFDKQIIFDPNRVIEIDYLPGAHKCDPKFADPFTQSASTLYLLHFKYLGLDYLIKKHKAYAARMSDYNKQGNYGGQYLLGEAHVRECFELLRGNGPKGTQGLKAKPLWEIKN